MTEPYARLAVTLNVSAENSRMKKGKLYAFSHFQMTLLLTIHIPIHSKQVAEIKKSAKEGNNDACKSLARQLVAVRKQKNRTLTANSKITSVGFQNKNMGANIALGGVMAATSQAMGEMNKVMRPEKIAGDMREFAQANMKMEMTDEMSTLDDLTRDTQTIANLNFFFLFFLL